MTQKEKKLEDILKQPDVQRALKALAASGGAKRWKGVSKQERSKIMSATSKKRWNKT